MAAFRGYVNPLRHIQGGSFFAFQMDDAETKEELQESIIEFTARGDEFQANLAMLATWRVGAARCDTTIGTQDLLPHVQRLEERLGLSPAGLYVNVGASDGRADDPLFEYARQGARGVAVERSQERCRRHGVELPQVTVICEAVTPQNVVELVRRGFAEQGLDMPAAAEPPALDVIKVDIDSFDCPVAEALLGALSARLVLLEVNPSIPPPYQWAMLHHPGLWPFFSHHARPEEVPIRGCSLAYEVDLMTRLGYELLAFGGHDALFAHRSVRHAFAPAAMDEFDCFNEGFIAANGVPIANTRRWFFEVNDTNAGLVEIWDFFTDWMRRQVPDGQSFPFALRV